MHKIPLKLFKIHRAKSLPVHNEWNHTWRERYRVAIATTTTATFYNELDFGLPENVATKPWLRTDQFISHEMDSEKKLYELIQKNYFVAFLI